MLEIEGACPVCERSTTFVSKNDWLRDSLRCKHCKSIPRERAFAWALSTFCPDWRDKVVHESSPSKRLVSARMQQSRWNPLASRVGTGQYIPSQYFPDVTPGTIHKGFRSENLEALSFEDGSIDLHCHLDVLEHVNDPSACFAEMARTLKVGGMMIFTTPVFEGKIQTERRAEYGPEGIVHFFEPEYHGNPISGEGSPVTFHYGSDLSDLILEWAPGCAVKLITLNDPEIGVLGKFREVFVVTKNK